MTADIQRLYQDVEFLTSITPARNYQHPESLDKVCQYLKAEFAHMGLPLDIQTWQAEGRTYTNIIASYQPEKTKRLIVGAHYDVCGEQPGADDNASAVAGLLETARLISQHRPKLDFRIDFVSYCLEEPPFFATQQMGSYVHAKSLKDSQVEVIGMICYEMIGFFSDEPYSQNFPNETLEKLYPNTGNFIMVVGMEKHSKFSQKIFNGMKKQHQVAVYNIDFPDSSGLGGLSDHRNYWAFGYDAVMINDTSFLRNPHYHEPTDTIETLSFDKMKAVVDAIYHTIVEL